MFCQPSVTFLKSLLLCIDSDQVLRMHETRVQAGNFACNVTLYRRFGRTGPSIFTVGQRGYYSPGTYLGERNEM
jgi:hypothetical protein